MRHVRDLLAQIRDELTPRERARLDEHLATCADCRALEADLARTDRLLSGREPSMTVPGFDRLSPTRERAAPYLLLAGGALALLAIVVLAPILGTRGDRVAQPPLGESPSPAATTAAAETAAASPSATPLPPRTFENEILGYRITMPDDVYRLSKATIITGQEDLGGDMYTPLSERAEREQCLRDSGDIGVLSYMQGLVHVGVSRNPRGLSAREWITTPRTPGGQPFSANRTIEDATIDGHEAVKLVDRPSGDTTAFVISANERFYLIHLGGVPIDGAPKTWLDDIAKTFVAITPGPFPTPTATPAPHQTAQDLADKLAAAFASKDAAAVARLMSDCWLYITVDLNGMPAGGVHYRSVALFRDDLSRRFAAQDLTITVDRSVEPDPSSGPDAFVMRSEWKEADRTSRVDLTLMEVDGRWQWHSALHYGDWPCRGPWVSGDTCPSSSPAAERTVQLYHYDSARDKDASGNVMCSDKGLFPVERRIPVTSTPIQDTIRLLIRGELTPEERNRGITTEFPLEGFELTGATLTDGVLTLTFHDPNSKSTGGACRTGILASQVRATAAQFAGVREVVLRPLDVFQP